jgi:hypothetical protein
MRCVRHCVQAKQVAEAAIDCIQCFQSTAALMSTHIIPEHLEAGHESLDAIVPSTLCHCQHSRTAVDLHQGGPL